MEHRQGDSPAVSQSASKGWGHFYRYLLHSNGQDILIDKGEDTSRFKGRGHFWIERFFIEKHQNQGGKDPLNKEEFLSPCQNLQDWGLHLKPLSPECVNLFVLRDDKVLG